MTVPFPRLSPELMTGNETFIEAGARLETSVLDFWRWQGSNLLDNALRGILAEFLVAKALNCDDKPRVEWDGCDCRTSDGIRVEVKSSAYIQSWDQKRLSKASFNIGPRQAWDAATNEYSGERGRHSDVYVFCLYAHTDQKTADPLNLSQWEFYVLPTRILDGKAPTQQSISLSALVNRFAPATPSYTGLAGAIRDAANSK